MLALIWFGIFATLGDQYANAARAANRDTANLARAFEENTARVFANADQIMLSVRMAYEHANAGFDLDEWARTHMPADRLTAQIAIIDRNGMVVASTVSRQRISVGDRPHFRAQRESTTDALYIGQPVLGRISKRWTIQVTRKLIDATGVFDGVVVLSIDCLDLSKFYQTIDLQHGFIAVLGLDGIVRARGPVTGDLIGVDQTDGPAMRAATRTSQGTEQLPDDDGHGPYTVSYRRLQAYPLVVLVAFSDEQIFARYWRARLIFLGWGSGGTAVILFLGVVWMVQRSRALASRQALSRTLESMDQGIIMLNGAGHVAVINRRAAELLRLPDLLPTDALISRCNSSSGFEAAVVQGVAGFAPPAGQTACTVLHPDGTVIEGQRQHLPDGGLLQTVSDVTARRQAEDRIRQMAHYDHLTGLGNRVLLADEISDRLARWGSDGLPFPVLCIDLDGFKKINDTLGHDVGDAILAGVAERLRLAVSRADFLARSGGDEFIILAEGVGQSEDAKRLAQQAVEHLGQPYPVGSQLLSVGASVGIAICPDHGADRHELMKHADLALYCAKSDKLHRIRIFEPDMAAKLEARSALERDLTSAVAADALDVVYQPQFKTANSEIVGFEALVRWQHPRRGAMQPGEFIALAEETGLIVALGRQVLRRACTTATSWPARIRIAVNISPVQFRDEGLPGLVAAILAETNLAPDRLELEVTEGVLIADEQQALNMLHALRGLGIRVALDDFGTGYSSLSYLRRFSFDCIKLDRSFVQAQVREPKARAILDSVLRLSRRLQLSVVAEGVETEEQLCLLREQRCPEVQGYLLGRPRSARSVADMFASPAGSIGGPFPRRNLVGLLPSSAEPASEGERAGGNTEPQRTG